MKKFIRVIYSSHKGVEYDQTFEKQATTSCGLKSDRISFIRIENYNTLSLAQAYNSGWKQANPSENEILLFVHNDVHFKTKNWGFKLLEIFNNEDFDIVGLAGTDYLGASGVWWEDRSRCYGIVNHTDGTKEWETAFAPPLQKTKEVVIIDGLFIAVNPETVFNKFDEEFPGFHMYDLAFVLPNFLDGCKVGVTTKIRLLHESIGMVNPQWEANRIQFAEKYKEDLPFDLKDSL